MPGSSVSACHMCHLHSHNQDNLVRTSPLRNSRGRSKSSSKYSGHKHHHGHSNSGYSSSREDGTRVHRSNSASALARLTDNAHSLPGSRSNSLTRYHREVSILPDGGDTYGRCMRSSSSTRSLDMNPPMTNILDVRTTSLPRVSSILHSQNHIHAQPDILVNAMPRSRANSRSGSISRNAVNLSQDNSHDYYLDIHRQRFKEEKRKHRFNLQTVMLIGCYTVLIMIAIVVGIVLCYQNGWFGLGPPQDKITGDVLRYNNSHSLQRDAINLNNRRKPVDNTNSRIVSDGGRTRPRNREHINSNVNDINNDHKQVNTESINTGNVLHQIPNRNEETFNNNQRNIRNRNQQQVNVGPVVNTAGVNSQIPHFNVNSFPIQSPNIPLQPETTRHIVNEDQRWPRPTASNDNVPIHNINQGQGQIPLQHNKHFNHNAQIPTSFSTGVPLAPNGVQVAPIGVPRTPNNLPSDIHSNVNANNRFVVHIPRENLPASGVPLVPNNSPSNVNSNLNSNNKFTVHNNRDNLAATGVPPVRNNSPSNINSNLNSNNRFIVHNPRDNSAPTGVPLIPGGLPTDIRSNTNANNRLTVHLPVNNLRSHPSAAASQNTQSIRKGNVDSNTIAKTLISAGVPLSQSVRPNLATHDSKLKLSENENTKGHHTKEEASFSPHDLFSLSSHDKILSADTGSLTTQQLLDILAIRRMRDLLNSEGNAKSILNILRNVEPSQDMRLEMIKKERVEPIENHETVEHTGSSRRGKGRSIQIPSSDNINNIQIRRLIEAMIKDKEDKTQESSNISVQIDKVNPQRAESDVVPSNLNVDSISSNINHLINNTINGAIIRLLNKKNSNKENDQDVDVNISGVSVFPLNSQDLRILLESTPANVQENIGPLDDSKIKSLQILHRLIELNNLRQKVQKHIGIESSDKRSGGGSTTPAERAKAPVSVSRIGIPHSEHRLLDTAIPKLSKPFIPRNSETNFHNFGVPLHNVSSSFNRGSHLSIDETHRINPVPNPEPNPKSSANEPDPTFAVMVRTDGLNTPTQNRRTVNQRTHQPLQSQTQSQIPIKEEASIQPGTSRDSENKAIIRAWTHMDSEGTLSKGRIHSDGSFTFTNCRPVEVCGDKNNQQNSKTQNEAKQN